MKNKTYKYNIFFFQIIRFPSLKKTIHMRCLYLTVGVSVANILDCNFIVNKFQHQSYYYVIIIIIHHHRVVPPARLSLTLSRHFSLSFIASGRSSGLHPVSSHSCCM